jgi:Fe-S-cluster containining protein
VTPLIQLHNDIEDRVRSIRADRSDWLCGKGCDGCCHRLSDIPQLTGAEWELLREGLSILTPQRLEEINQAMIVLAGQSERPVVCPLLDQASGTCLVYDQRPVACRTYGFYVQRDLGLYCREIESRVASGRLSDVVWGNHDAVDQRLGTLGEVRSLTEWFQSRHQNPPTPTLVYRV